MHREDESHVKAAANHTPGGQCKTWKKATPFSSFQIKYLQPGPLSSSGDNPEDKICMLSVYEEGGCDRTGRYQRFNATTQLGKCMSNLGGDDAFKVRSVGIDCVGGNGYHDNDWNYDPRDPEDECWHQR